MIPTPLIHFAAVPALRPPDPDRRTRTRPDRVARGRRGDVYRPR